MKITRSFAHHGIEVRLINDLGSVKNAELMGWLVGPKIDVGAGIMKMPPEDEDPVTGPIVNDRIYPTRTFSIEIKEPDLAKGDESWFRVPSYAKLTVNPARGSIIFIWQYVHVEDVDVYARIFDYAEFIPYDPDVVPSRTEVIHEAVSSLNKHPKMLTSVKQRIAEKLADHVGPAPTLAPDVKAETEELKAKLDRMDARHLRSKANRKNAQATFEALKFEPTNIRIDSRRHIA